MSLQPGTRIGAYEIVGSLGAGGMGEVYRARDARLKRDVAIKVLGADVTRDPDRLARFAREARILAALNHNNIAHVYGVEDAESGAALVMELVTGRTLAEILRGPGTLAMAEALAIARQIAEALEAAHDAGVIHRDLKPANVMVRPDGVVKVLDFGLATTAADAASADQDTVTSPVLTARGVILGTAAYMSPEQAKGLALDRRTDIWSFGVVLFELLSARRLFQGTTVGEIAASVIKDPIDFSRLPAETPQRVRTLLARCLDREPRLRLRDVGEARVALSLTDQQPSPASPPVTAPAPSRGIWLALIGAVAGLGAVAGWTLRPDGGESPASNLVLPLGGDLQFAALSSVAVSPDGRSIVYAARSGVGASQISSASTDVYLRRLDDSSVVHLGRGTNPFWSPDGQSIGFTTGNRLHRVAATGGPSSELHATAGSNDRAFWAPNGTILSGLITNGTASIGIRRFSTDGGETQILTTPDHGRGETLHLAPQLVSGGRAVLYTVRSEEPRFRLDIRPLTGDPARTILEDAAFGQYIGDGLLLYQRRTTLFVARVDPNTLAVRDSVPIVENVADGRVSPTWSFAAGTLVYRPSDEASRVLLWVSRDGRDVESVGVPAGEFSAPKLSPDGRRIAVTKLEGQAQDVWVFDAGRLQRVTTDGQTRVPVWSADGQVFVHRSAAANHIFLVNTDGSGQPQQITTDGYSQGPAFATPDGKSLVFHHLISGGSTGYDLWIADLTGASPPRPLLQSRDLEAGARLHPAGRWIAYAMIRGGREEVWIASFPEVTRKIFVSGEGSREPVWSRDGRELFFRNRTMMYSVQFRPESADAIGQPKVLFDRPFFQTGGPGNTQYDVGNDGRFLMLREPERQLPHWIVMQGWTAELKAALDAGK